MFYVLVPFFKKDKPHKEVKEHSYAVLISARNEEKVIGNLIQSIFAQTYNQDLIKVFVVADNCTDGTADVARREGAIVYERFNQVQVGKGYALEYLLNRMETDYGWFDGYFVFDADNVLDENYITEMNKTFSDGYKIITSYRNSKNYGDNWISAGYGLWFLREAKYLNYSRMLLGSTCAVSGTGFLFSQSIIKKTNGWKFFFLTEDIQFTIYNVVDGETIGYCKSAILYDEQPVTFKQSWNQRLRWAKGFLQVFKKYGKSLAKGTFQGRFSCYDMMMTTVPATLLSTASLALDIILFTVGMITGNALWIHGTIMLLLQAFLGIYLTFWVVGFITTITEWKQIYTSTGKKLWYMFTFPVFMMTYIPIGMVALFKKVEWSPIEHNQVKSLAEIRK
jgi:cellulose synthase/poly-beta-1,6-N-acetylglucosamine synthase-like glycosyltransferase